MSLFGRLNKYYLTHYLRRSHTTGVLDQYLSLVIVPCRVGANAKFNVNIGGSLTCVRLTENSPVRASNQQYCTCETSNTSGVLSPVTNVGQVHQSCVGSA